MSSRFVCLVDACTRRRSRRYDWFGWTRGYREGGKSFQGTWSCMPSSNKWLQDFAGHGQRSLQETSSLTLEDSCQSQRYGGGRCTYRGYRPQWSKEGLAQWGWAVRWKSVNSFQLAFRFASQSGWLALFQSLERLLGYCASPPAEYRWSRSARCGLRHLNCLLGYLTGLFDY